MSNKSSGFNPGRGGDGKGSPKIPDLDQQAQAKRDARNRKKERAGKGDKTTLVRDPFVGKAKEAQKLARQRVFKQERAAAIQRSREAAERRRQEHEQQKADAIARSRAAAHKAKQLKQKFTGRLSDVVKTLAERHQWSDATSQLANTYVDSLINGDGTVPEGLRGKPLEQIQQRFALTCLFMNAREGSLPGMRQDWFPDRLNEAAKFQQRRTPAKVG